MRRRRSNKTVGTGDRVEVPQHEDLAVERIHPVERVLELHLALEQLEDRSPVACRGACDKSGDLPWRWRHLDHLKFWTAGFNELGHVSGVFRAEFGPLNPSTPLASLKYRRKAKFGKFETFERTQSRIAVGPQY